MKNILVTGGAGYIGSHACKTVARAGYVPITYDNLSTGKKAAVKWGPLEIGSLQDKERLKHVLQQYEPIAVMHFAASTLVGESVTDPAKYYQNNLLGTFSLLETILEFGALPFIFSSTCAIYGEPVRLPIDEEHPQNPITPYGHSKRMVEQIIRDFSSAYGLPYAFLRYFNAAGADLEGEIGEEHDPETHLVPLMMMALYGKRPALQVFGDGSAIRDFIHVQDLADAHLSALEHLLKGRGSLELNLGTGRGTSVNEIIAVAERLCGKKVPLRFVEKRAGDPLALVADVQKSAQLLGFTARYSDLETILTTAASWHAK